jgi:hypothetical protein
MRPTRRGAILAIVASLFTALFAFALPPWLRLPFKKKRRGCPGCADAGQTDRVRYAWERHFELPVWPTQDTQGLDQLVMGRLGLIQALDIASSPASPDERQARLSQIKAANPDLHAYVLHELAAMATSPIERMEEPHGGYTAHEPGLNLSYNVQFQQILYRTHDTYIPGAVSWRISYEQSDPVTQRGEGSNGNRYWLDLPIDKQRAYVNFQLVADRLPAVSRENFEQLSPLRAVFS